MSFSAVRSLLLATIAFLALALVPSAAVGQAPAPEPFAAEQAQTGKPIDRFADRRDSYDAVYELITVPKFPGNQPAANSLGTSAVASGQLTEVDAAGGAQDTVRRTAVTDPIFQSSASGLQMDGRVRPAAITTNLTVDALGDPNAVPDLIDRTLMAYGCRLSSAVIRLCMSFSGNEGQGQIVLGGEIKPGTAIRAAVGQLATDDQMFVVIGYVEADGGAIVESFRVTPGLADADTESEYTSFAGAGSVGVFDPGTAYPGGGPAAPAADLSLAVGDFTGSGRDEVMVSVGSAASGGVATWRYVHLRPNSSGLLSAAGALATTPANSSRPVPHLVSAHVRAFAFGERPAFDALYAVGAFSSNGSDRLGVRPVDVDASGGDPSLGSPQELRNGMTTRNNQAIATDDTSADGAQDLLIASTDTNLNFVGVAVVRLKPGDTARSSDTTITTDLEYASFQLNLNAQFDGNFSLGTADLRPAPVNGVCAAPQNGCRVLIPAAGRPVDTAQHAVVALTTQDGTTEFRAFRPSDVNPLNPLNATPLPVQQGTAGNFTTYTVPAPSGVASNTRAPLFPIGAYTGRSRIGEPTRHTNVTQEPLVVLNAPPTHLDVIGNRTFDVNTCDFRGSGTPDCQFYSQFSQSNSTSDEITSENKESYGLSVAANVNVKVPTTEIDASLKVSQGGEFIDSTNNSTTTTVALDVKAQDEDQVYMLNKQYDTLEYPIYGVRGRVQGYIAAVTPTVTSHRWVGADGTGARELVSNHQVGNLLSYPRKPTPEYVPGLFRPSDLGTFGSTQFEVNRTSDYTYTVTQDKVTAATNSNQITWGIEAGFKYTAGAKIFSLGVEASVDIQGNYAGSRLNTTTTTVNSSLAMQAKLGRVSSAIGRTEFLAEPFLYFTEPSGAAPTGALVLDWAVTPSEPDDGADSFWQANYGGRPDLTFNMPHFLAPARGIVPSSEALRRQTKSVTASAGSCGAPVPQTSFYPRPGQPVCLRAQVENYSLKDLTSPVQVTFYAGDPAYGGREIGTANLANVAARGTVAQRTGQQVARVDWTPPADLAGTTVRVFAVVDRPSETAPDGVISEVHANNNKAWAPLTVYQPAAGTPEPLRAIGRVTAATNPGGQTAGVQFRAPDQPFPVTYQVIAYPLDETGRVDTEDAVVLANLPGGTDAADIDEDVSLEPLEEANSYVVAVVTVLGAFARTSVSYPSEPLGAVYGAPSPPRNLVVEIANAGAFLAWEAPRSDGTLGVERYVVSWRDSAGNVEHESTFGDGNATRIKVYDLTNGEPYEFWVTAVNAAGESRRSNIVGPLVPVGDPDGPTGARAKAVAGGSADITWTEASPNGQPDVSEYVVTASPGGATATVAGTETSATIIGLTPGTEYEFTVEATFGTAPDADTAASDPSNAIIAFDVPGAPGSPAAVPSDGALDVTWDPADERGRAITAYRVTVAPAGITRTLDATARSVRVTGLPNGTAQVASVRAVNAAGDGPVAAAPSAVPFLGAAAPTGVEAVPGNASAQVSWVPPTATGGHPITGFVVRVSPGGAILDLAASATSAQVTGLVNGRAYRFTVAARTAVGLGAASDTSESTVPRTTPSVPVSVRSAAGERSATVTWLPPASDGGLPITRYVVTSAPEGLQVVVDGSTFAATFPNLEAGRSYTFKVAAASAAGAGPESDASPEAVILAPPTPVIQPVTPAANVVVPASAPAAPLAQTVVAPTPAAAAAAAAPGLPQSATDGHVLAPNGTLYAAAGAVIPLQQPRPAATCRIGNRPAAPCPNGIEIPKGLAAGAHTVTVSEPGEADTTVRIVVDKRAPKVTALQLPTYTRDAELELDPRDPTDAGAGVGAVEVRYRTARATGRFARWKSAFVDDEGGVKVKLTRGHRLCVQVRATDSVGNRTRWTKASCTVRALDDRDLSATGATTRGDRSSAYEGGVTAMRGGGMLSTATNSAKSVVVLLGNSAPGSRLYVRIGNQTIATLTGPALLRSTATVQIPSGASGPLRLVAFSGEVEVDGVALVRKD